MIKPLHPECTISSPRKYIEKTGLKRESFYPLLISHLLNSE
ncbi:unnamed protein product [Musa acuminata subsp. burmannicoides]